MPSRPDLDDHDRYATRDASILASIAAANELGPTRLHEHEVQALVAFLHALTDPAMLDLRRNVPASVPSGLPVAD